MNTRILYIHFTIWQRILDNETETETEKKCVFFRQINKIWTEHTANEEVLKIKKQNKKNC